MVVEILMSMISRIGIAKPDGLRAKYTTVLSSNHNCFWIKLFVKIGLVIPPSRDGHRRRSRTEVTFYNKLESDKKVEYLCQSSGIGIASPVIRTARLANTIPETKFSIPRLI